jgi:cytochrome c biogenesis protein CcmG, thiol:disulfide interchange protein DsbE
MVQSSGAGHEDGKAHIREFDGAYPNGPEPDDISVDFGILGVPETFIIDPDGLIVGRWVGPMDPLTIDDMIEEFVGE